MNGHVVDEVESITGSNMTSDNEMSEVCRSSYCCYFILLFLFYNFFTFVFFFSGWHKEDWWKTWASQGINFCHWFLLVFFHTLAFNQQFLLIFVFYNIFFCFALGLYQTSYWNVSLTINVNEQWRCKLRFHIYK